MIGFFRCHCSRVQSDVFQTVTIKIYHHMTTLRVITVSVNFIDLRCSSKIYGICSSNENVFDVLQGNHKCFTTDFCTRVVFHLPQRLV